MNEAQWDDSTDLRAMMRLALGWRCKSCGGLWCSNEDGSDSMVVGQKPCSYCDVTPFYVTADRPPIASDRKLRLWAIACSKAVHPHGYWEGKERRQQEKAVYQHAEQLAEGQEPSSPLASEAPYCQGLDALIIGTGRIAAERTLAFRQNGDDESWAIVALRDLLGNPHRQPDLICDEARRSLWFTPTAKNLAEAAYQETGRKCRGCNQWTDCKWCHNVRRIDDGALDPVRLAILADALEEAGATGALVDHLRSSQPHYPGCWVLDLILGKT